MRAYYTLIDKDSKIILEELQLVNAPSALVELVKSVKDSQKHFYLFLQNARNSANFGPNKLDKSRKPNNSADKQSILSVLTEFSCELSEYVSSVTTLDQLKFKKEQMFPYSNMAILDDFKKINSLSLIIKLLKKENRTEIEELKTKVQIVLTKTFFEMRKPDDKKAKDAEKDDPNDPDSPTLKKLKEMNKKYYSDKFNQKA